MVPTETVARPSSVGLGANEFTFTGDRTSITYYPSTPGPVIVGHEGGELRYAGPEGDDTFFGPQIDRQDGALGTLLTVTLRPDADAGAIRLTLIVPAVYGVTRQAPVTFGTLAIKTTSRGFIGGPGVELTYDVLPLVGEAKEVELPV